MPERALSRGAAVTIITLPDVGEPYYAGRILDLNTARETAQALREVVARKNLDIPHLEELAARLGAPGTDYELRAIKWRRDKLHTAAQFFQWVANELEPQVVTDN